MATTTCSITEQQFQQALIEYAALKGYLVAHFRPAQTQDGWRTAVQGDAGFPDLVLTNGTTTVFAELKSSLGDLSPEQYEWLYNLQMSGEQAFLWSPEDWDEIMEVLI